MAESKQISRSKLKEVLQAAGSRDKQKVLMGKLRERGYDIDNPVNDEVDNETYQWPIKGVSSNPSNAQAWEAGVIPTNDYPTALSDSPSGLTGPPKEPMEARTSTLGLGKLGRLGTQFERGFREVPGLPDASFWEKGVYLAGEEGLPMLGASTAGPAGAAAGKALQKGASRSIEALTGQEIKNESPLDVVGDVAKSAVLQKVGEKAASGLAGLWGKFKGAAKEVTIGVGNKATKVSPGNIKTYIENSDEALKLADEGYQGAYQKAVTPEGSDTPLKQFRESLKDKFRKLKPSDDEVMGEADRVINNIAAEQDAKKNLLSRWLQLQSFIAENKSVDPVILQTIAKEVETLRKVKTPTVSLQDGLDALQIVNAALKERMPRDLANSFRSSGKELILWLESNGLPGIREGMKAYNIGSAGKAMSNVMPRGEMGQIEMALRSGLVGGATYVGGPAGLGAALAAQSPRALRAGIDLGLGAGKVIEGAGSAAAKAVPLGQLANSLGKKKREDK